MRGKLWRHGLALVAFSVAIGGGSANAQELSVVSVSPTKNGLEAGLDVAITVEFDRPVDPTTFTPANFGAFGRWSGRVNGTLQFSNANRTVTLTPNEPLSAGELVSVNLSKNLKAADASPMRNAGYSYQFWTRSRFTGTLDYSGIATMTTGVNTRPYAGVATDLNNDGWLDLTVVNEDTADLRVYLNQSDGTGSFAPYIQPTFPAGNRASPVETQDFNGDGNSDIAVANINANSVSILLGTGTGTYAAQQLIAVGATPRGIAVLDADGDGDADIVNTNFGSNNLSLMLNNGAGVFGAPSYFEGGVNGERSLTAGDMNNDGIADLVVGGFNDSAFRVLRGNGNGTFSQMPSAAAAGGQTWELALGDVNGDGNLDVVSGNGFSENGSVALGAGNGTLGAPVIYNTLVMGDGGNSTPTGMDIGDLDGDGDLDWVVSPFGGTPSAGDWLVLLNDGAGSFSFQREINSQSNPAWAMLADIDNDGDLDLSLVDEEADHVKIFESENLIGDMNYDGGLDLADMAGFHQALADPASYQTMFGPKSVLQGDADGDGDLDFDDAAGFLALLPPGASFADFNADGTVNGADYEFWRSHFGATSGIGLQADGNFDGITDAADYVVWRKANISGLGSSQTAATPAVPEPSTAAICAIALAVATCRILRRR